jgi:hypothetical protein
VAHDGAESGIIRAVKFRTWLTAGWYIAVWTVRAIFKSPGDYVDFYFRDRYVPFSKRALIAGVVAVLMAPLVVVIWRLGAASR